MSGYPVNVRCHEKISGGWLKSRKTEAGRQWATVFEGWLLEKAVFERVFGVSQIFLKRNPEGEIVTIMAKVAIDLLMAGPVAHMKEFVVLLGIKVSNQQGNRGRGDKVQWQ